MVWDTGTWEPQNGYEDVTAGPARRLTQVHPERHKAPGQVDAHPHEAPQAGSQGHRQAQLAPHQGARRIRALLTDPAITDPKHRTPPSPAAPWTRSPPAKTTSGTPRTRHRQPGTQALPPASTQPRQAREKPAAKNNISIVSRISSPGFPKKPNPPSSRPQLALEAGISPRTSGWLHELKLDGYRIQARKSGNKVHSSPAKVSTGRTACPRSPLSRRALPAKIRDPRWRSRRPRSRRHYQLRRRCRPASSRRQSHPLTYFVFDLLHLEGHNPRDLPLQSSAKQLLAQSPRRLTSDTLRFQRAHRRPTVPRSFIKACELHAEGIISKRADSPYRLRARSRTGSNPNACASRNSSSAATHSRRRQRHARHRLAAAGLLRRQSKLIYAGRTGTGFTQKTQARSLHAAALETPNGQPRL